MRAWVDGMGMKASLDLGLETGGERVAAADELIRSAQAYHTPAALRALLEFTRRLPAYSPFNCLLLHLQNPEVTFVAPADKWRKLRRSLRAGARPWVILAPMHPVMFVFDVADTEGAELPPEVRRVLTPSFSVMGEVSLVMWNRLLRACARARILVESVALPRDLAGDIGRTNGGFRVRLNEQHSLAQKFATLVHELGHLFCGHLGGISPQGGPSNRMALSLPGRELEAEAVAWLVCQRCQIWPASARYLSGHLAPGNELPEYSLEALLVAAGAVEQMIRGRVPAWLKRNKPSRRTPR